MRNCHRKPFSHQKVLEDIQGKDFSDPHLKGAFVDSVWSKPKGARILMAGGTSEWNRHSKCRVPAIRKELASAARLNWVFNAFVCSFVCLFLQTENNPKGQSHLVSLMNVPEGTSKAKRLPPRGSVWATLSSLVIPFSFCLSCWHFSARSRTTARPLWSFMYLISRSQPSKPYA